MMFQRVMRYIRWSLLIIFMMMNPGVVLGQQGVSVEASTDKTTLTLDDQLVLTIRVKGANVFSEPRIPSRGNFDVLSRGSSSHIEMINGHLSASKEYTYVLAPKNVGDFDIGPISVEVQGVEYTAGPMTIHVVSGGSAPAPIPPTGNFPATPGWNPPSAGNLPPSQTPDSGQYKDIFATAEVDNKNPYVGEQTIYIFRLYTSRNVDAAKLDLPDFHDFWNEEIQKENKYYKELGGRKYVVSEFRVALFPSKAGALTVGEATVKGEFEEPSNPANNLFNDPFFSFRTPLSFRPRVIKAPPVEVQVQELPSGAPAGFKGLVGTFTLDHEISKTELTVGETATLTVRVSGSGNIKDAMFEPNFQIPNLKVYDDKPVLDLKKTPSGVTGVKTFKYALVPEAPGRIQIPSLGISYFDPKKQSYETPTTSAFEISVVPGATQEKLNKVEGSVSPQGSPVNTLGEDIASIHREVKLVHEEPSFEFFYLILVLFAAPPVILFFSWMVLRHQRWRDENSELIRKKRALSRASTLIKEIDFHDKAEVPARMSHILKEYLGDKLGRVGTALTPIEVEQFFSENQKRKASGSSLVKLLQDLDAYTYGGFPQERDWENTLRKRALQVLKEVDKIL